MFFKRMFKKPPPAEPVVERLSINDLHERLKKLRGERLENGRPRLNALIAQMVKARETLLNELKTLADDEPREEIHPGLMKSAIEARKLLIDKLTRGLADAADAPEFSVTALAVFDEKLTKTTNLTTDAMVVHGRYVGSVFGSRFATVQLCLRDIHGLFRQAHTAIDEIIHDVKSVDTVLSEADSMAELAQNAEKTRDGIKSLEGQAKEIEGALKEESDRLAQLESSDDFKRATDSVWEVNKTRLEISRVEGEVVGAFSEISRPLRKMENLVASGKHQMDRGLTKTLKLCIDSPIEVISSDEKVSAAEALLQETSKLLSERKIDLEDKERRKKLERTRQLAAALAEYKKRLELLNKQLEVQVQTAEHPIQKQVVKLKQSIEHYESKLKRAKTSAEELDQKLKQMKDEIEKKRLELEKSAGETLGAKVELTF